MASELIELALCHILFEKTMDSKFVLALFSAQDVLSPDLYARMTQVFAEYLAAQYPTLPAEELNFLLRVGGTIWRQDQEVRWKAGKRIASGGMAQSAQALKKPFDAYPYPVKPCSLAVALPKINVSNMTNLSSIIKGGANDPDFMLTASSAAAHERSGADQWNGRVKTSARWLSGTSKATDKVMPRQSRRAEDDGRVIQPKSREKDVVHASLLSRARELIAESHVLITRSRNLSNQARVF